jgi:hypothetical protein
MRVISLDEENKAKKNEIELKKEKIKRIDENVQKLSKECSNLFKTFESLFDFDENGESAFFQTALGLFEKHMHDTKTFMTRMIAEQNRLQECTQIMRERQRMIDSALKDSNFIRERTKRVKEITTKTRNEISRSLKSLSSLNTSIQESLELLNRSRAQEHIYVQKIHELQMEQEKKREMQRVRYLELKREEENESKAKVETSQEGLNELEKSKENDFLDMKRNMEMQWKAKLESLMTQLDQDKDIANLKSSIKDLRVRLEK